MDSAEFQLITNLINSARTQGITEIEYKGLRVKFRVTPDGSAQTVSTAMVPAGQRAAQASWSTLLPTKASE